jgi:type IV pilus biogenesis protein PilP
MFASDSLRSAVAVAALLLIGSTATAQSAATGANAVPADLVQAAQQRPVVPSAPALVVATPAPPAPATSPAMRNSVSASEIALINERMSVMQATLAELELQVKMATKRDELRKLNSGPIVADDGFTPSVVEIGGMDGKLTANLMMQGGNVQAVRVGDRIGGWQIKDITIDSLTMVKGKESKRLAFGTAVAQPQMATPPIPGAPMQAPVPFMR